MDDKKINLLTWLVMLLMLGYFSYSQGWIFSDFENLSTQEGEALIKSDKNLVVVDVRSADEYNKDSIEGAINIPFSELKNSISRIEKYKKQKILLYSERGKRSIDSARLLSKEGFLVVNLKGGVVFWLRNGYLLKKN
jgi:rhodanese-related sulfurtransferase